MESIAGSWQVYLKIENAKNYGNPIPIVFNPDGKWHGGNQNQGYWFEQNGLVNWDPSPSSGVTYPGTHQGGAMVGVFNINETNFRGQWYALRIDEDQAKTALTSYSGKGFPTSQ